MRRATALLAACAVTWSTAPAAADPSPVVASLLSASSALIPVAVGSVLLLTGAGAEENVRFHFGMTLIGIGSILGPSAGQMYAGGGWDALLTFLIRVVTGGIMLAGIGLRLRGDAENQGAGTALLTIGAIPTGLLAIYDIWASATSAKESRYELFTDLQRREAEQLLSIAKCGAIPCGI